MTGHQREPRPAGWALPMSVGAGAALGLLTGLMLDQLALGLAIGAGVGVVVGAAQGSLDEVPPERRRAVLATAVAVLLAGITAAVALARWG